MAVSARLSRSPPAQLSVCASSLNRLSFDSCAMQYTSDLGCFELCRGLMRRSDLQCHLDLRWHERAPMHTAQVRAEQEAGDCIARQSRGVGGVSCVVRSVWHVCLQLRRHPAFQRRPRVDQRSLSGVGPPDRFVSSDPLFFQRVEHSPLAARAPPGISDNAKLSSASQLRSGRVPPHRAPAAQ